jgi:preprotein translocase SecE subunit
MAKSATNNSEKKAGAKEAGRLKGALSRQSKRASMARPSSSPRGAVATKPAGKVRTFLREVKVEMSKVTWPPRKELLTATGVVIVAVIIAGVYIGVFDYIWNIIVRSVGLG